MHTHSHMHTPTNTITNDYALMHTHPQLVPAVWDTHTTRKATVDITTVEPP